MKEVRPLNAYERVSERERGEEGKGGGGRRRIKDGWRDIVLVSVVRVFRELGGG